MIEDRIAQAAAEAVAGRLADPFAMLGPHDGIVRTFQPGAVAIDLLARDGRRIGSLEHFQDGLWTGRLETPDPYLFRISWPDGREQVTEDPYAFGLVLGELDLHLFAEGRHWKLAEHFGAQVRELDGVVGTSFAVWAPNARRVSVVGDFNLWDGRRHPMRLRPQAGVWELFVPRLRPGERYKYEIVGADGELLLKADPMARATECPPATGSVVAAPMEYRWNDREWMESRSAGPAAPMSIYEVHAGSWLRPHGPGTSLDWDELGDRLIPYVAQLGFTHVELLPIMEHPFGGSWGYQPLSQFAPSARFGKPEDFARFVDRCHREGIGVILDWVPAHFPSDPHGLARFDGTHLFEHADPREGFHQDWNTLIYNLGRREVSGFLIASALWWLETFHVDALRVDAVASMLYRDYSRKAGEWIPNVHGGRENLENVAFLQDLNRVVAERCPGAVTMAEESTAWPGVTAPVADGGLGFSFKWNMGWMHDSLSYVERDPVHRKWHHHELTFSLVYAWSEHFVLPLSHDEVVHGKGSLLAKMPGDRWRQLATLRAYLAYMWAHPGKKLLFMGAELGQESEWDHDGEIAWHLLDRPEHAAIQRLVGDLNRLLRAEGALHRRDCDPQGFEWLVGDDSENSLFAFVRHGQEGDSPIVFVVNMTPRPHLDYRLRLPRAGRWQEILNSDSAIYGGSDRGNQGWVIAEGEPAFATLVVPPLGALMLRPEGGGIA